MVTCADGQPLPELRSCAGECDMRPSSSGHRPRLRVGSAVGVNAAPAQFAMAQDANSQSLSFNLHWVKCPPDADATLAMLSAGLLDVGLIFTEDVVHSLAEGSALRICGTFTSSPRRFSLHTSRTNKQEYHSAGQTASDPLGVPFNSLGAQIALYLFSQSSAWGGELGGLYLRQFSSIEVADAALQAGRVKAVLWEHHAACKLVAEGKWSQAWETELPWASVLYVASKDATYAKARSIEMFVDWTARAAADFLKDNSAAPASQLLASSYRMVGGAAIEWLSSISWKCRCEVDNADLMEAIYYLMQAGLVTTDKMFEPSQNVAKTLCTLREVPHAAESINDGDLTFNPDDDIEYPDLPEDLPQDVLAHTECGPVPAG
eukprot:TRINITY_DN106224_c0_g1_i1.p1 TRINITY_DN106224_c0_g1~~TRINITY_DN106224_c0_g1_i1.p1  ORF type:complete len:388 (+),score=66.42 TRINITY_DN106224_c0_g1_i1:38-1165(+)